MLLLLQQKDQDKIRFLARVAGILLQRLNVPYSKKCLESSLAQEFHLAIEAGKTISANPEELNVVDDSDASNLAIVLVQALKRYHIKHEVSAIPVFSQSEQTLIILTKTDETQSYHDLLGAGSTKNSQLLFTRADRKVEVVMSERQLFVENFVVLKKTAFTGEPGYQLTRRKEMTGRLLLLFAVLAGLGISAVALYRGFNSHHPPYWIPPLIVAIGGLMLCYTLFRIEKLHSFSGYLARQFCPQQKKSFDCRKVLASPAAKLFGLISMTDIGIIYFCSLLLYTMTGLLSRDFTPYRSVLSLYAVVPLPYSLFSIYYQLKVLRKTCALCMIVQGILWIQAIYFVLYHGVSLAIPGDQIWQLLLIIAIVSCIYSMANRILSYNIVTSLQSAREYVFINDEDIFKALQDRQPEVNDISIPGAISLGNPEASKRITVVLSLTCSACGSKMKDIVKLVDWFGEDLDARILVRPDQSNIINRTIIGSIIDEKHAEAADVLYNWYDHSRQPSQPPDKNPDAILATQVKWYKENYIPHTPFIIYNGRWLPRPYYDLEILKNIIEREVEPVTYETE